MVRIGADGGSGGDGGGSDGTDTDSDQQQQRDRLRETILPGDGGGGGGTDDGGDSDDTDGGGTGPGGGRNIDQIREDQQDTGDDGGDGGDAGGGTGPGGGRNIDQIQEGQQDTGDGGGTGSGTGPGGDRNIGQIRDSQPDTGTTDRGGTGPGGGQNIDQIREGQQDTTQDPSGDDGPLVTGIEEGGVETQQDLNRLTGPGVAAWQIEDQASAFEQRVADRTGVDPSDIRIDIGPDGNFVAEFSEDIQAERVEGREVDRSQQRDRAVGLAAGEISGRRGQIFDELEAQAEEQIGRDLEPGEDFTVTQEDGQYTIEWTDQFLEEEGERDVEAQAGRQQLESIFGPAADIAAGAAGLAPGEIETPTVGDVPAGVARSFSPIQAGEDFEVDVDRVSQEEAESADVLADVGAEFGIVPEDFQTVEAGEANVSVGFTEEFREEQRQAQQPEGDQGYIEMVLGPPGEIESALGYAATDTVDAVTGAPGTLESEAGYAVSDPVGAVTGAPGSIEAGVGDIATGAGDLQGALLSDVERVVGPPGDIEQDIRAGLEESAQPVIGPPGDIEQDVLGPVTGAPGGIEGDIGGAVEGADITQAVIGPPGDIESEIGTAAYDTAEGTGMLATALTEVAVDPVADVGGDIVDIGETAFGLVSPSSYLGGETVEGQTQELETAVDDLFRPPDEEEGVETFAEQTTGGAIGGVGGLGTQLTVGSPQIAVAGGELALGAGEFSAEEITEGGFVSGTQSIAAAGEPVAAGLAGGMARGIITQPGVAAGEAVLGVPIGRVGSAAVTAARGRLATRGLDFQGRVDVEDIERPDVRQGAGLTRLSERSAPGGGLAMPEGDFPVTPASEPVTEIRRLAREFDDPQIRRSLDVGAEEYTLFRAVRGVGDDIYEPRSRRPYDPDATFLAPSVARNFLDLEGTGGTSGLGLRRPRPIEAARSLVSAGQREGPAIVATAGRVDPLPSSVSGRADLTEFLQEQRNTGTFYAPSRQAQQTVTGESEVFVSAEGATSTQPMTFRGRDYDPEEIEGTGVVESGETTQFVQVDDPLYTEIRGERVPIQMYRQDTGEYTPLGEQGGITSSLGGGGTFSQFLSDERAQLGARSDVDDVDTTDYLTGSATGSSVAERFGYDYQPGGRAGTPVYPTVTPTGSATTTETDTQTPQPTEPVTPTATEPTQPTMADSPFGGMTTATETEPVSDTGIGTPTTTTATEASDVFVGTPTEPTPPTGDPTGPTGPTQPTDPTTPTPSTPTYGLPGLGTPTTPTTPTDDPPGTPQTPLRTMPDSDDDDDESIYRPETPTGQLFENPVATGSQFLFGGGIGGQGNGDSGNGENPDPTRLFFG